MSSTRSAFSWISKGSTAVLENGLVSGSNFVISIFLARWLSQPQYGAFTLAFSIALLFLLVHFALVLEPLSVNGGAMAARSLRPYLKSVFLVHAAISSMTAAALGIAALVALKLHYAELPAALAGLSLAVPCLLLFHLARRIFYVRTSPGPVALGAALYFLLLLGGLLMLRSRMTPFLGFILMGAAALGSSCFLFWRATILLEHGKELFKVRETWQRHWDYGRWAIATAMLGWVAAYACYPIMSAFGGMSQVGALKAVMNFAAPVHQTLLALSGLILPYASGCERRGSPIGSNRITALFLSGALVYWIAVMCAGNAAFRLVYGGKYLGVRVLLPLFAVESIIWAAGCGPKIVLRAMNLPHCVFHASFAPAVLFLALGIPSAKRFGIVGLISAMALADLASYLIALWLLRRNSATRVTTAEPVLSLRRAPIPTAKPQRDIA